MPTAALGDIHAGSDVFLDANVFVHALLGQSAQCRQLLERCAHEEVFGVTSLDVVVEATHRLMLAEAHAKGLITRQSASKLKEKPQDIRSLGAYWTQAESILNLNIMVLDTDEDDIRRAQTVRSSHGLLTRDSVLVAIMWEYGLASLASRDHDFDRVPGLVRYEPTDVTA